MTDVFEETQALLREQKRKGKGKSVLFMALPLILYCNMWKSLSHPHPNAPVPNLDPSALLTGIILLLTMSITTVTWIIFLISLVFGFPWISIQRDQIIIRTLFKKKTYAWSSIEGFYSSIRANRRQSYSDLRAKVSEFPYNQSSKQKDYVELCTLQGSAGTLVAALNNCRDMALGMKAGTTNPIIPASSSSTESSFRALRKSMIFTYGVLIVVLSPNLYKILKSITHPEIRHEAFIEGMGTLFVFVFLTGIYAYAYYRLKKSTASKTTDF